MNLHDAYRELALFETLPDHAIDTLVERTEFLKMEADTRLFSRGDPSDALYMIKEGYVKIVIDEEDGSERLLNQVGPNIGIGQITIVKGSPRTASMITLEPTDIYKLCRDDLLEVVESLGGDYLTQMEETANKLALGYMDVIKNISLFSGLSHEALFEISEQLEPVNLKVGEVLFYEGEDGDALYVIKQGRVKIVTEDAEGAELVLSEIDAGESVGELALIDRAPRSATVVAVTESELLKLGRDAFLKEIQNYPEIALDIMRLFSHRIRFASSYLERIVDASRVIAAGEYEKVKSELMAASDKLDSGSESDERLINSLMTTFIDMIEEVQGREEELKKQVQRLTIQIDESKRKEEVENILSSDFFADLKSTAKKMRDEMDE